MQKTNAELMAARASLKGVCDRALLHEIIKFVETCPVLSEEDKTAVTDGLADWL
jgi:hypothetical protein